MLMCMEGGCAANSYNFIGTEHGRHQGVVTYMSPVEVIATGIKIFDGQKVCLIT